MIIIGGSMKALFQKMDKPSLFFMILYTILSLVMILSASSVSTVLRYGVAPTHFFIRQLLFVSAAFLIGMIMVRTRQIRELREGAEAGAFLCLC